MKKTLSCLMLILAGTLASCNLFIDDEIEDLSNGLDLYKKTVYTGEGWSEPTTEVGEDYNITYQYFDNVKLLTDEIQSYIVHWEVDDFFGCIGIIDFREDTPERFLPRIGEIVTSRSTALMPEGFYAEVLAAGYDEGVYRVATCAVELNKVFKKLEGEIDLTLVDDEALAAARQGGDAVTRADDEGESDLKLLNPVVEADRDEYDKGKYMRFTIPIKAKIPLGKFPVFQRKGKKNNTRGAVIDNKGNVTKWKVSGFDDGGRVIGESELQGYLELRKEETKMTHRVRCKLFFSGSIIPEDYVWISDTISTKGIAHIMGGIDYSKSIDIEKVIPKIIPAGAGPISYKIIIGGGVSFGASIFGSCNVHFNDSCVVNALVKVLPPSPMTEALNMMGDLLIYEKWAKSNAAFNDSEPSRHIAGSMSVKNGNIEGSFNFSGKISAAIGFGTKKINLGAYVKNSTDGEASSFGIAGLDFLDISDAPGFTVTNTTTVGLKAGVTLNVYEIVKGIQEDGLDLGKLGVKGYRMLINKLKEEELLDDDFPTDVSKMKEFIKCCEQVLNKQSETVDNALKGIDLDLDLPEIPIKNWSNTVFDDKWMPQMKGFSYKLESTTPEGATYKTTWTYSTKGILPSLGFGPYYPCIYVDGGKNDPATGTYYPDLDGYDETDPIDKNTNIKSYGTGITISKLKPGKDYTVYPALSLGRDRNALFRDVGQTISVAATTVKTVSAEQESCYRTESMKEIDVWGYIFKVKVAVKGAARVYEWKISIQFPTTTGKYVLFEKEKKRTEIIETDGFPIWIDVVTPLSAFETNVNGWYKVIESTSDKPEDLSTSEHEMTPYPLLASWSTWEYSRSADRNAKRYVSPYTSIRKEKIAKFMKEYGDDIPVVFFDDDDEPAVPVAIIENGIRKPLPPLK